MFKMKKGILLLSVFLSMIVLSACDLFTTDDQVVQKMMERYMQTNSSTVDGSVKITMGDSNQNNHYLVKYKGRYAKENLDNSVKIRYSADYNLALTVSFAGMPISADADIIQTENQIFFKLNTAPLIPIVDWDEYKNQWYVLDFSKMMEMYGAETSMDVLELTDKTMEINQMLMESKILKVTKDFGKTKIGDSKVYHYRVALKQEVLQNLWPQILEKLLNSTDEEIVFDDTMKTEIKAQLDQTFEMLNISNIEVFIDSKTFDLRKMVFDAELSLPATMGIQANDIEFKMKINIDMLMDNFDTIKIDEISLPTETEDIFEKYMEEQNKMMTKYIDENGQEITEFKLVNDEELTQ